MRKFILLFIRLFLFFFASISVAQKADSMIIVPNVTTDKVQLKWLPTTYNAWMLSSVKGYTIDRTEVIQMGDQWTAIDKKTLTTTPIQAMPLTEMEQQGALQSSIKKATIYWVARDIDSGKDITKKTPIAASANQQSQRDFIHLAGIIAALTKNKTAEAMGMFFEDKTVVSGKRYLYTLRPVSAPELATSVYVVAGKPNVLPNIVGFDFRPQFESVELLWIKPLNKEYLAYDLYRSTSKNGEYSKLNKLPYFGDVGSIREGDIQRYIDSFPDKSKTYYYKMRGVTAFEQEGPFSTIIEVVPKSFLTEAPKITRVDIKNNKDITITWSVSEINKLNIESYKVFTTRNPEKGFKTLSALISPSTQSFIDPRESKPTFNYYMVCAYGKSKDSLCSFMKEGFLIDSFPPKSPIGIVGTCDSNGVVRLHWNKNKEEDVIGYRVFKTVDISKEPVRVSVNGYVDTLCIDTVSVKHGYRYVHYSVVAIDEVFNASSLSPYAAVKLPDNDSPNAPLFLKYEASYSGIFLEWKPSSSKDVAAHILYRKSELEFQWTPIATFTGANLYKRNYRDTVTETNVWYEYTVRALDSSGLYSPKGYNYRIQQPEKDPYSVVTNLRFVVSREHQKVKLVWDFNKQATGFIIMRSINGKPVESYQYIKGTQREFYDSWLVPNTTYSYAIIAELPNNRKSIISKIIQVNY